MANQGGNDRLNVNLVKQFGEEPNFNINRPLMVRIFAEALRSPQAMQNYLLEILRRLNRRNPQVAQLALILLDSCVYALGVEFHLEVAKENVVEELNEIFQRNIGTPLGDELLACLKRWSDYQFKDHPQLLRIPNLYNNIVEHHEQDEVETIWLDVSKNRSDPSLLEGAVGGMDVEFVNEVVPPPPVLVQPARVIPGTSKKNDEAIFLTIINYEFARGNGRRFNRSGLNYFVVQTTLQSSVWEIMEEIYGVVVFDEARRNQSRRLGDLQTNAQKHLRGTVIALMQRTNYSRELIQFYENETRELMDKANRGQPRRDIRLARQYNLDIDFE